MIRFLEIFGFLSVLLRGLTLASEALTVGGVVFLLFIASDLMDKRAAQRLARLLTWSCIVLALSQASYIVANSAILIGSTGLSWTEVTGAGYCLAGVGIISGAIVIAISANTPLARAKFPIACAMILFGSVMTSHSAARLEQRWVLAALTATHQGAAGAWIGGMPYLLVSLANCGERKTAATLTSRFSKMAMLSVALVVCAGAGMSFFYVGSPSAAFGTTYGIMVVAKVGLTGAVLAMGALNYKIVRAVRSGATPSLLPLRRFAEVEVGIGLTIILAAAALTSAPPAVDVKADRVTAAEIAQRVTPKWPSLHTPPLNQMSPPTPLDAPKQAQLQSFVPGQVYRPPLPGDIAWSEYNHHWAGLIVLAMGILSLAAKRFTWARHWPIVFLGLAAFLLVRADPENWPLGPRSFWQSFQVAEVAQHRVFVLLIVAFAAFEWAVQTERISPRRAGLVFPLVCAIGGALLLTHSHSVTNVKEEFLAELSHLPLAVLGVIAGWSRWLELRLEGVRTRTFAGLWPLCFIAIGAVLLNYREA